MNDITQLSTLYSNAIARAEKAEEELRTGVKVKPLEWRDGRDDKTVFAVFQIAVILGADNLEGLDYAVIGPDRHDLYEVVLGNRIIRSRGTEADAKAAAQADFDQRILSALVSPPPVRETP